LRKGELPVLPGEEREEEAEGTVSADGVHRQTERAFFSGAFKIYTTPREGRPRRFRPNNEPAGRGMGGSQPGEGGLAHPQAPTCAPNFSYF
jgi:hypothetical protein